MNDILCKETKDCNGILKRFLYMEDRGITHEQFQCTCCKKYVKRTNGKFYSAGLYNV